MNTITLFIIVGLWFAGIVKLANDQNKLLKAYKAKIDPQTPLSLAGKNFLDMLRKRWAMPLRYPNHPELDRLAKTVRYDLMGMCMLFVLLAIATIFLG